MLDNISIRAGYIAIEIIRDEGLNPERVKVLAGASGSVKFLVLTDKMRKLKPRSSRSQTPSDGRFL